MYAPYNAISGNMYTGQVNISALTIRAAELKTQDPRWLTFLQAKENGYKVKKGAKGTRICFMSFSNGAKAKDDSETTTDNSKKMLYRHYVVFNASEVEGIPAYE